MICVSYNFFLYSAIFCPRAGKGLGGQLEWPQWYHRSRGQGHLPHDAGHGRPRRRPRARRHSHQPHDSLRMEDAL